jgi:hypothetical protein
VKRHLLTEQLWYSRLTIDAHIMQITIDLPPDLEQDLIRQAAQSNVPLQTLVLQALRQLI